MSRPHLVGALLLAGASGASAFAGLGVALYGSGPHAVSAATLFAAIGFATGMAAFGLPRLFDALPSQAWLLAGQPAADGRSPLQRMAAATLATVQLSSRESLRDSVPEAMKAPPTPRAPQAAAESSHAEHDAMTAAPPVAAP